jgi:hypothetical protein
MSPSVKNKGWTVTFAGTGLNLISHEKRAAARYSRKRICVIKRRRAHLIKLWIVKEVYDFPCVSANKPSRICLSKIEIVHTFLPIILGSAI